MEKIITFMSFFVAAILLPILKILKNFLLKGYIDLTLNSTPLFQ